MNNVYVGTSPAGNGKTKEYGTFRGLDAASAPQEVADYRSPAMHDMYIKDGVPVKRHGYEEVRSFSTRIRGLHKMPGAVIVHTGYRLVAVPADGTEVTVPEWEAGETYEKGDCVTYDGAVYSCNTKNTDGSWTPSKWDAETEAGVIYAGMSGSGQSAGFYMNNALYVLDGKRYSKITREGTEFRAEAVSKNAHVPVTGIGGYYNTDTGTPVWCDCRDNEERNLLTPYQINTMAGDGTHTEFWLTRNKATVTLVRKLNSSGNWVTVPAGGYTVADDTTRHRTKVTFSTAPGIHPEGAGLDSIEITFWCAEDDGTEQLINNCTFAAAYGYFNDNRVFLSGNRNFPNRDWASGIDDPSYIEENGWANIGSDASAITGYLHYGDVLAIMKEDNDTDAEIYIRSGQVKEDGSILFPVQQGVFDGNAFIHCKGRDEGVVRDKSACRSSTTDTATHAAAAGTPWNALAPARSSAAPTFPRSRSRKTSIRR